MEVVLRNARKPEPYATPSTNTVTQAQLDSWRKALDGATNALARGNKPEAQRQWLPHHIVTSMLQREDQMRISLAPFLHASRYTSYGRHFTLTPMLKLLSEQLVPFMDHEDTVVDFSCGANEWVPLMKRECAKHGKQCRGRSFDIITPMDVQDYVQKSWFDVRDRGDLAPDADKLVIGLNPPFGANNSLANKFTMHAAAFSPRLIVLIVPPSTAIPRRGDMVNGTPLPHGYNVIYEDHQMLAGKSFKIPGVGSSWNHTTPPVRLLAREDWFDKVRHRCDHQLRRSDTYPRQPAPYAPAMPMPMHPIHSGGFAPMGQPGFGYG
ncbi:hypothetical protein WJX73_001364 [Symbiochloris irregularis]|uniref:DM2 domain-containing protein n=1 Tax=Symbiochloris irregularis TaxID=706552 RepID=A0AAW1NZT3_9CHLO